MAVKRAYASYSCVEAAQRRVQNVFDNGLPVYMSLSGGKDSICMANVVYKLIQAGKIDPKQLTCVFIDEEAIYDCCIEAMMQWRKRFLLTGAKFDWYCLPFKQVCCLNSLTNEESWITWEPGKDDLWVRKPPSFAIMSHPTLTGVGQLNYQSFLNRATKDGIMMTGVRAAESVQRLQYMSTLNLGTQGITGSNTIYPIYDWEDNDVWMYIRDNHLDIPEAYLWLYQEGVKRPALRISNFFGIDSLAGLRHVAETDPDLWARIEKREPNAYMVLLYWDSEWYKRSTRKRKKDEASAEEKDYKAIVKKMIFDDAEKLFTNKTTMNVCIQYRRWFTKIDGMARQRDYRKAHDALIAGDPKLRSLRALYQDVYGAYAEYAKQYRTGGGEDND